MKGFIQQLVRNHAIRHGRLSRSLFVLAQAYRDNYLAANNYAIEQNGERAMMRALRGMDLGTIFDVSANDGDWAAGALDAFPNACGHCFELSRETAATLAGRFIGKPNVLVNPIGLSDRDGNVSYYCVNDNSSLTSLSPSSAAGSTKYVGQIWRGDACARSCGVETVDMVKIDVEGHELAVIQGLGGLLRRVTILQFEYNDMSWRCGHFLDAFQRELPEFAVGRLPGGGVI